MPMISQRRFTLRTLLPLLLLAMAAVTSANAAVLVSDDFNDGVGGMPSGWSYFAPFNSGTANESGTSLGVTDPASDGPTLITPGSYDPQGATTTLSVNIVSNSGDSALFGIADASITNILVLQLRGTGDVMLFHSNTGAGSGVDTLITNLAGYSGGAMDLSFSFDDDSFSVLADGGSYDSGDILYSTLSGGLNFAAFGNDVGLALGASDATVIYDSVLYETTGSGLNSGGSEGGASVPTPAPFALFGLGLLALRRRSARNRPDRPTI